MDEKIQTKTTHKENQSQWVSSETDPEKTPKGLSLHPVSYTKGSAGSWPPVLLQQPRKDFPLLGAAAVQQQSQQRLRDWKPKKIIINVVCQDMNYLLPQFRGVINSMPTNKYRVKKGYCTNPEFCSCTVSKRPGVLVAMIFFFSFFVFLKGFYGIGRTILRPSHLHRQLCACSPLAPAACSGEASSADH